MVSDDEEHQLIDAFDKPSDIEKIHASINFSLITPSEILEMRHRLITGLRSHFTEYVESSSSGIRIRQAAIDNFEDCIMTLPDHDVFNLYSNFSTIGSVKSEKGKDLVRRYIIQKLIMSYSNDSWLL